MDVEFRAPGMHDVADRNPPLVEIAHGLSFGEGPVWDRRRGCLYYVDIIGSRIWRWTPGIGSEIVLEPSMRANGMTFDHDGCLVVAGWSGRRVFRLEKDGSVVPLATHYEGQKISSPNDIVVRSDGTIYWTEMQNGLFIPGMEGEDLQRYLDWQGVFRLAPSGELEPMATDFNGPNGLAFSPDEKRLYVNDTAKAHIRVFDVDAAGNLANSRVFYELVGDEIGHADGMKVDVAGNLYCTGPAGIHVIAPDGTLLGRLLMPAECTNMAWGDDDWRSLYITTHETVYRTRLKIQGIPVW